MLFRQGDVLLEKIDEIIPGQYQEQATDEGCVVLAYGEVTGHAHALDSKITTLYAWQGDRLLEIKEPTFLEHGTLPDHLDADHLPVALSPGVYRVFQQREYSPEAIRNVAD